jgi:hypothetical protein
VRVKAQRRPAVSASRFATVSVLWAALCLPATPAFAQDMPPDSSAAARAGAIAHAQKMRRLFPDVGGDAQATPAVIP